MAQQKLILGIETSCDETAASVVSFNGKVLSVLSNAVASQIPIHRLTGGVVPEVAAREHVTTIIPTIKLALSKAKLAKEDLDAVAVTAGPGLLPALMVGVDTANALSLALGIPVIPVQHISGHIYANFLSGAKNSIDTSKVKFPLLALVVSGGHTEFILMTDHLKFRKIGLTLDDAAGEAFDKTAKILGLPYPGGPQISLRAQEGNPEAFAFPRPLLREPNLDFSFAGLKTAVLYKVQDLTKGKKLSPRQIDDLAASTQAAIIETLVAKTKRALIKHKVKTFTLGGGVAANTALRQNLASVLNQEFPDITYLEPQTQYATDNAAMVAAVGHIILASGKKLPRFAKTDPQWEI